MTLSYAGKVSLKGPVAPPALAPLLPWEAHLPPVDISLHSAVSRSDPALLQRSMLLKFLAQWSAFLHNYTDGSKSTGPTGAGFIVPDLKVEQAFALPDVSVIDWVEFNIP